MTDQLAGAIFLCLFGAALLAAAGLRIEKHGPEPRDLYRSVMIVALGLSITGLFGVLRVVFFGGACG